MTANADSLSLKGRLALVTGASSGIGRATALALAGAGASVVLNHLGQFAQAEVMVASIEALGVRVWAIEADVSSAPDVKRLADRAKIPLEYEKNAGEQQTRHLKDSLLQIHEQITQRWQNALLNEAGGQIARDYLMKRGVSPEAVKLFRLGYAPDAWDDGMAIPHQRSLLAGVPLGLA